MKIGISKLYLSQAEFLRPERPQIDPLRLRRSSAESFAGRSRSSRWRGPAGGVGRATSWLEKASGFRSYASCHRQAASNDSTAGGNCPAQNFDVRSSKELGHVQPLAARHRPPRLELARPVPP